VYLDPSLRVAFHDAESELPFFFFFALVVHLARRMAVADLYSDHLPPDSQALSSIERAEPMQLFRGQLVRKAADDFLVPQTFHDSFETVLQSSIESTLDYI